MKILALCASGATISIIEKPVIDYAKTIGVEDIEIHSDSFMKAKMLESEYDLIVFFPPLIDFANKLREELPNKKMIVLDNETFQRNDGKELYELLTK